MHVFFSLQVCTTLLLWLVHICVPMTKIICVRRQQINSFTPALQKHSACHLKLHLNNRIAEKT